MKIWESRLKGLVPGSDARVNSTTQVSGFDCMDSAYKYDVRRKDERLFTTILSSAYSLQQQHDRIRAKLRGGRFSEIMGEVIATQSLIRKRNLDTDTALHLVVNRTQKLAKAAGAALALLDGADLDYKAGTGLGAMLLGLRVPANASLSFDRLKTEQWVETDTWQDMALTRRLVARVLSVPVYTQSALTGCIQLFCRGGRFEADSVPACELMASIVGLAISDRGFRQSGGTSFMRPADSGDPRPTFNGDVPLPIRSENFSAQAVHDIKREFPRKLEQDLKKPAASARLEHEAKASPGRFATKSQRLPIEHESHASPYDNEYQEHPYADGLSSPGNDEMHTGDQGEQLSISGFRIEGRVADHMTQPSATRPWPEASLRRGDHSVKHLGQMGHDSNHAAEGEVSGRQAGNRLRRIAYPVFVLFFAIFVRLRAGVHSWALEIFLYLLIVLTTLELRRQFLE